MASCSFKPVIPIAHITSIDVEGCKESEIEVGIQRLATEEVFHILQFLPLRDLAQLRLVNRKFLSLVDCSGLPAVKMEWEKLIKCADSSYDYIRSKFEDQRSTHDEELTQLMQTLKLIKKHAAGRFASGSFSGTESFLKLTRSFASKITLCYHMAKDMCEKEIAITDNIGFIDLALGKALREFVVMYPLQPLSGTSVDPKKDPKVIARNPSIIIHNSLAKSIWKSAFGEHTDIVDIEQFYNDLIIRRYPEAEIDDKFLPAFSYCVDFPSDGLMTTFRWSTVIDQFGPPVEFYRNFSNHAYGNGFIGTLTTPGSIKLIEGQPTGSYLIRFSRRQPELITVTHLSDSGNVTHSRKPPRASLSDFLKSITGPNPGSDLKPVDAHIDTKLIKTITEDCYKFDTCEFFSAPLIHPAHSSISGDIASDTEYNPLD